MNNLYFYDVYNDPTSSYRSSEPAMQAICNLYGVEYGEGTPYATLRDAYLSINGYNLTEAQALMKAACDELVAEGLYKAGDAIHIRIGYKKGALENADNQQVELMNKYINAAAEGSGFGPITLEPIGNIDDRYAAVPAGEYAIGYGAWGGAAFYPFRNMQVYCDTEQYSINEAACWDPATETLTINVNGEDVTMTWYEWSGALIGTGRFNEADFETKLKVTATMEEEFLKKYYRIPLAGSCICEMLSYQCQYYTEDYNIMYGFGGIQLMKYNYSDAQWAEYVQSQGGTLSYE
jgi:oligopeptide transport system substrate-binding protein